MRRPTPLPANPVTPAVPVEQATSPVPPTRPPISVAPPLRRPARSMVEPAAEPGREPTSPARPETPPRVPDAARAPTVPAAVSTAGATATPIDAPAPAAEPDAPTRVRDVWRATRARRKALRSEVRRFTVRARRRRLGRLLAAVSMLALVITTLVVAYSPLFAVEKVVIEGAVRLDAASLEAAVSDQIGRPLPRVDESEIKAALVKFPMVESYQVEARPPHELLVRIVERTPIGVLQGPAGYSLVDAAGVVLDTTPERPAGAPLLEIAGGTGSAAFESAGLVMRALPDSIRGQVTGVSATTRDDVTLLLGDSRARVVWGSVDDSALKALVLETAMQQIPPSGVVSYDVSSPGAIVIR